MSTAPAGRKDEAAPGGPPASARADDVPTLDATWFAAHPLPAIDPEGDKEGRGHVLVVGGSAEIPGAVILAATAALRAGAGKLSVLTDPATAPWIASAVPESRAIGASDGWARTLRRVRDESAGHQALLIGPGMSEEDEVAEAVEDTLRHGPPLPIVLDAAAICTLRAPLPDGADVVITPHAGELASLLGRDKDAIVDDPEQAAVDAARHWRLSVLSKGATTIFATADGAVWRFRGRTPGLGTSGSGDVLAGILAGLLCRGASLPVAAAWAVATHMRCGRLLEASHGEVGYLAREMVDQVPRALRAWADEASATRTPAPPR